MSESGVKNAVAQRVVRPHELQQWHRNWNGTPNRKVLRQHNIETAIEYLPRPRQWLSPLSASPAKMRAFYSGDDTQINVRHPPQRGRCRGRVGGSDVAPGQREGLQEVLTDETSDEARSSGKAEPVRE